MNPAHVHLALNHVPIIVTVVAAGLLAFALVRRSDQLVRVSTGLLAIAALATIPVFVSGEPAEEIVEHRAEVSEAVIERHEAAAKLAAFGLGVLGAGALAGLLAFARRERMPGWFSIGTLALSLVAAGLLVRTANLGGQIRHAEIRGADSSADAPLDDD